MRGVVAEAIAALVSASGAPAVGAEALRGRWRLRFTTAPDVLALLGLERLSEIPGAGTVRVGDIDQVFDGDASSGTVLNEASFSIPPLVDSVSIRQERATATCDFLCLVDQFHIEPWDLPREFLSDLGGETVEVYF